MSNYRARPTCEPLEARVLPSAGVAALPLLPPTPGGSAIVLTDPGTGAPRGLVLLGGPRTERLADLEGDGRLDRVVASGQDDRVRVYPGRPDGSFGREVNGGAGFAVGADPTDVSVIDVNGDGVPDLVVTSAGSGEVTVLLGARSAVGWSVQSAAYLHVGRGAFSTLVADVNGDGVPDLVVTCRGDDDVWVLPARSPGVFDERHARVLAAGLGPTVSVLGDFDGRARLEMATLDTGGDTVTVHDDLWSEGGPTWEVDSGGPAPVAALVEDVNGDGYSDLMVAHDGGPATLLLGGPAGLSLVGTLPDLGRSPTAPAGTGKQDAREAPTPAAPLSLLAEDDDRSAAPLARVTVFRLDLESLTGTAAGVAPVLHTAGEVSRPPTERPGPVSMAPAALGGEGAEHGEGAGARLLREPGGQSVLNLFLLGVSGPGMEARLAGPPTAGSSDSAPPEPFAAVNMPAARRAGLAPEPGGSRPLPLPVEDRPGESGGPEAPPPQEAPPAVEQAEEGSAAGLVRRVGEWVLAVLCGGLGWAPGQRSRFFAPGSPRSASPL
jgi:hypothetical protein